MTNKEAIAKDINVPCNDTISRQAAIDAILHNQEVYSKNFGNDPIDKYTIAIIDNDAQTIAQLPSVLPEWNNHTVACVLAELFDDPCACNYNGIDEWLPEKCEVIDACPNPVGVACWEQYLKHRVEGRSE